MIKNQNRSKDVYCVYIHTSPSNKNYVGITSQEPKKRWRNGSGYRHSPVFNLAIKKYGWKNFCHDVVAVGLSKEEAERLEVKLIAELKSNNCKYGYNVESGGNLAGKHSEETKRKISNTLKGHAVSLETREKLRISHIGKKGFTPSAEHLEKIKEANRKREWTEETRMRLSISHKCKRLSLKTRRLISENRRGIPNISLRKPIAKFDKNGVEIDRFCSITIAEEKTGISKSNISNVLKNKRKTAGGYYWQYI